MSVIGVIILLKSRDTINKSVSFSAFFLAIFGVIRGIIYLEIFLDIDLYLKVISGIFYSLAPLGILVAGFIIIEGSVVLKNRFLFAGIFFYLILGIGSAVGRYLIPLFGENSDAIFGFLNNLLVSIIFLISLLLFLNIRQKTPEMRKQMNLLVFGILLGTIGIISIGIFALLGDDTLRAPALLFTVVGSILALLSFVIREPANDV